jgi:hypothetical protein
VSGDAWEFQGTIHTIHDQGFGWGAFFHVRLFDDRTLCSCAGRGIELLASTFMPELDDVVMQSVKS